MARITALYARVSTANQSLDWQKEETYQYAVEQLSVEPSSIEIYTDTGTGRNTQRDGYQGLMNDVRAGEVERVIVLEISRLSPATTIPTNGPFSTSWGRSLNLRPT